MPRKRKRKSSCLAGGKGNCAPALVTVAKTQAKSMLSDAQKHVIASCAPQLSEAREAFQKAEKTKGGVLERRNAFIRATYLAGQAKSCSTVASVGPRQMKGRTKARKKKA
jgi:hypothetical protein